MRPLELTLEGFRSYRDRMTFQLEGRGLFGIVGPTGAGKSSILDGLVYGLFGRTNRLGRETTKLVNSSKEDAKIQLTFEVDAGVHEVTRVLRRKGNSQVTLCDAAGQLLASGERAVNAQIEELVGLDFDAFCSSVVLPQGEFDRFLHATASERSQILKKVFRLERVDAIRALAKERLAAIDADRARLDGQISSLGVTPDQIEAAETDLNQTQARAEEIADAAEQVAQAEEAVRLGAEKRAGLETKITELSGIKSTLPSDSDLQEMADVEERLERLLNEATTQGELSERNLTQAEWAVEELEKESGVEALSRAETLIEQRASALGQLEGLQSQLRRLEQEDEEVQAQLQAAIVASNEKKARVEAEQKDLERIAGEHSAMELRRHLEAGEPCPVCEQNVEQVPAIVLPAAMTAVEKSLKAAHKELDAADRLVKDLERKQALAKANVAHCNKELASVRLRAEELTSSISDLLSVDDRFEERAAELRAQIDSARSALKEAAESRRAAVAAIEEVRDRIQKVSIQRREVAGHLIACCSKLGLDAPSVDDDSSMLRDAAKRALEAVELTSQQAVSDLSELDRQLTSSQASLEAFRERFSLESGVAPQEAVIEAREAVATCRERLNTMIQRQKEQQEAFEQLAVLTGRRGIYERLCQDLTDSRFVAYMLDEQRRLLSDIGSERLYDLTGRYRFDPEGTFEVVEERTGARRSSNTLSGGEMFLASLALALALAEAVSQSGSPLKCFFLDEGFGSLDAASLDLALEGIESLATPGRIIGLISHVGGIQTRLDDLIVLAKAEDGSTVVDQHEGPIAFGVASI